MPEERDAEHQTRDQLEQNELQSVPLTLLLEGFIQKLKSTKFLLYLTYMQSASCKMQGWMKHRLESRFLGEISIISEMQMIPPYGRSKEELKSLLMKGKEENEKFGLILNIQKSKIMASGPITSWQIDGGKMETVTDFIFLVSKITVDSDCSNDIKRCLFLGRKAMIKLDSVLKKQRHYFLYKGLYSQAIACPAVMYGYETWTIKKVEPQRIDAYELWYWKRLLKFPWTARRSSQSTLKEVNLEYSLEQLMLRLKLQYFGHMMAKS